MLHKIKPEDVTSYTKDLLIIFAEVFGNFNMSQLGVKSSSENFEAGYLILKEFVSNLFWEVIVTVNVNRSAKEFALKKLIEFVDLESLLNYKREACARIESNEGPNIGLLQVYKELIVRYEKAFSKVKRSIIENKILSALLNSLISYKKLVIAYSNQHNITDIANHVILLYNCRYSLSTLHIKIGSKLTSL